MSFLDDMENLVRLDPGGWRMEYNKELPLKMSYGDTCVAFYYKASGSLDYLLCHPGAFKMGWWERRRFRKIQRLLFAQHNRKQAEAVAEKVLRRKQQDTDIALAEVDSDLLAAFADLEAQEAERQRRVRETPVLTGFLKGVARKALTGKQE